MSHDALPLPPTCTDFPFLIRRVQQGVYEIDLLPRHAGRERLLAIARQAHAALPHLKLCLGLRPGVFVYFTENGEHAASQGLLAGLRFVRQAGPDQPYRETGALAERRQRLWEEVAREREADEMMHIPAEAILGKFDADAVTVTVRKPKPISGVLEHAGIRIRREREGR